MKQGKTEKAVFAKLSTEKVELGKLDDLKKFNGLLEADINKYDKSLLELHDARMQYKRAYETSEKLESELRQGWKLVEAQVNDVLVIAKEMGIDNIPFVKEANDIIAKAKEYDGVLRADFGQKIK